MSYYDRTDFSEGIDVNKASKSKEWNICHYFLIKVFKFQPNVCNRCHDLLIMYMNLSDIAIRDIKTVNYWCIITYCKMSAWPRKAEHYKT